ncbi:MAG: response regulator [Candidatus Omnitrophica bacterium]|nr:response regulator [Candidatus Omnitrophota bacterium]
MNGKLKILVVDDEPDALELFKDLFTKKGYTVECVPSGTDAISFIEGNEADAILLDIRMPVMDGIETLSKLKELKPDIPVVMLTAYGYDDNLINKALESGAAGYISKNLPLAQIVHTFQTLLSAIHRKK